MANKTLKKKVNKNKINGVICRKCGYKMLNLYLDDCPMCKICQGCGKIL